MEVEVSVTRRLEDLEEAFRLLTTGTAARVVYAASLSVSGALFVLAAVWRGPSLAAPAVMLTASVIVGPAVSRRRLRKNCAEPTPTADVVYRLAPSGLSVCDTAGERRYDWDDVRDIVADEHLLAVRVQPFRMLVIPRSSAPEDLPALAQRWWADARTAPPRRLRGVHPLQLALLTLVIMLVPLYSPAADPAPRTEPAAPMMTLPGREPFVMAPPPPCTRLEAHKIATLFETTAVDGPTWNPTGADLRCLWGLDTDDPDSGVVSVTYIPRDAAEASAAFHSAWSTPPDTAGGTVRVVRSSLPVPGCTAFEDVTAIVRTVHLLRAGHYVKVELVMGSSTRPRPGSAPLVALALAMLDIAPKA